MDIHLRTSVINAFTLIHLEAQINQGDPSRDNVLVGPQNQVKIIDFEFAQSHKACPCKGFIAPDNASSYELYLPCTELQLLRELTSDTCGECAPIMHTSASS